MAGDQKPIKPMTSQELEEAFRIYRANAKRLIAEAKVHREKAEQLLNRLDTALQKNNK